MSSTYKENSIDNFSNENSFMEISSGGIDKSRDLSILSKKILDSKNLKLVMLEISSDICNLVNADRVTLYIVNEERTAIISKVKTGLNSINDFKLPISYQSIAGYAAYSHQLVNISDVYDTVTLKKIHPKLSFLKDIDKKFDYRTRQMIAAPILLNKVVYGVLQVINSKSNQDFGIEEVKLITQLCLSLAVLLKKQEQINNPSNASTSFTPFDSEVKAVEVSQPKTPSSFEFSQQSKPLTIVKNTDFQKPININSNAIKPPLVSPPKYEVTKTLEMESLDSKSGDFDDNNFRSKATKFDNLVKTGSISRADLEDCMQLSVTENKSVEQLLINNYNIKLKDIGKSYSLFYNSDYEPFTAGRIRIEAIHGLLKKEFVAEQGWLPIEDSVDGLIVMCIDPEGAKGSRIVPQVFPKFSRFVYKVTTRIDFKETMAQFFGAENMGGSIDTLLASMDGPPIDDESGNSESAAADNELVKFVNKVIIDAYQQGVSDIHIEPMPGKLKTGIRFRIDGSLQPYIEVPAHFRQAMITRLKIMCDLDISERRKPQDGKIKFKKYGPLDIELRVATIPSSGGVEDVVMRILSAGEPIPLDNLGLTPHNKDRVIRTVEKPYGLFYVCGPTGSGKTTTLHSVLKHLNKPDTKIWTVEDPVEITQKGLRQVQINRKAGIDFALVMRAFLRADPDIIMVGESRDKETVSMGVEASLTGHLVFSTLHTNSAPESITRLLDMGMDPFNFADALLGILAQRLAKRLCSCKTSYIPSQDELNQFMKEYAEELKNTISWKADYSGEIQKLYDSWIKTYGNNDEILFYRPVGCDKCNKTGYKGRVGLHELLIADDGIKRLIQEKARVAEIFSASVEGGMRTLKMDGMEKVMMGLTDLKTVRSVCIK